MYRIDITDEALNDLRNLGQTHKSDAAEIFRIFQNASKSEDVNASLMRFGKCAGYDITILQEQRKYGRFIFRLKAYREDETTIDIRALYAFNHQAKVVYVFCFFLRNKGYENDKEHIKTTTALYDKFCGQQQKS